MMARWLMLCVLGLLAVQTYQQEAAPGGGQPELYQVEKMFDCSRPGIECYNNGTCEEDTGLCACLEDYGGPGCQHNASLITASCDDCEGSPCTIDADNTTTCICNEDKYGDNCEYPRVSLKCNPDNMEVKVAPLTNDGSAFGGKIYVREQAVDDGCYLTTDPAMAGGFIATLALDSCGGAASEADDEGNDEVSFSVVVQYNPFIQTEKDQIFTFVCGVLQDGGDQELDMSQLDTDADNSPLQEQTVKEDLKPVTLAVLDGAGAALAKPVVIGDVVTLEYTLSGGDVYDSFKIVDLVATNGLEGEALETLVFVRGGCVSDEAGPKGANVIQDFSGEPTSSIKLLFKVFKFLRTSKLSFRSNVKLCKDDGGNSTQCDITECEEFSGVGRRRRSVEALFEEGDYKEYNTTVYIYRPDRNQICQSNYRSESMYGEGAGMWSCLNQPGFLVLIVVLVLLLLLAIAVVAFFCAKAAHIKRAGDDQGYSNRAFTT